MLSQYPYRAGDQGPGAAVTITTLGVPLVPRGLDGSRSTGGPADRQLRAVGDRSTGVADRSLQSAVYLLHARRRSAVAGRRATATPDEIVRLVRIAVTRLGVTKVRFTGGEPLLAKHLEHVVAAAAALQPRPELALTTNGVLLAQRAEALARAGLDRVNVSLDSVDSAHFAAITRRDRLTDVLAGLAAASAAGLRSGQGECGAGPGDRPGRRSRSGAVLPRARLSAAHHRADAARCRTPLATSGDGDRRSGAGGAAAPCVHGETRSAPRGVRRRPSCGRSPILRQAAPATSGSSPRCRNRSARRATAPG